MNTPIGYRPDDRGLVAERLLGAACWHAAATVGDGR